MGLLQAHRKPRSPPCQNRRRDYNPSTGDWLAAQKAIASHCESRYLGRVPKWTKGTDCKSVIHGFESHLGLSCHLSASFADATLAFNFLPRNRSAEIRFADRGTHIPRGVPVSSAWCPKFRHFRLVDDPDFPAGGGTDSIDRQRRPLRIASTKKAPQRSLPGQLLRPLRLRAQRQQLAALS